jgi:hypothetical protein
LLGAGAGDSPRATRLIETARESLGTVEEVAAALAENLPQPKLQGRSRRRRRRQKKGARSQQQPAQDPNGGQPDEKPADEPAPAAEAS